MKSIKNIKKQLRYYDDLINKFEKITIGDTSAMVSYLTKKRSLVA